MKRQARIVGLILAPALLVASASALVSGAVDQGWTPLITLAGRGDRAIAVPELRRVEEAVNTILGSFELDPSIRKLGNEAWEELKDFQLRDFYELLPQREDGFHVIATRGEIVGHKYLLRQAELSSPFEVGLGSGRRHALGDFSSVLRARPTHTRGDHDAFLLQTRGGLGVGRYTWRSMADATSEAMRLVSDASESALSPETVAAVKRGHPALGADDVPLVGVLWEAYPALSQVFAQIGEIEDVVSEPRGGVDHLHLRARIVDRRLERSAPDLAKHLTKLRELARAKVRWTDTRGRSVVEGTINSSTLRVTLDCYVKDGRLVPFTRDKVYVDDAIDPLGPALARTRVYVDARLKMLGVVIKLDGVRANLSYESHDTYARFAAEVKDVPGVRVEGAALGFVPTFFVDMMIPGNIKSITEEMFDVAVRGNEGKGIAVSAIAGSHSSGGDAVLAGQGGFEVLDTFLVRTGMGIVSDRVLPNEGARDDIDRLLKLFHGAFRQDFTRFERLHKGG